MMHPIPLTEAILHHAYNNEESSAIRARIMDLEQKLRSLAERRKAVESFEEQISIEAASRELRDRFDEEKAHWKKLSWAMEVKSNSILVKTTSHQQGVLFFSVPQLLEWDRRRTFGRLG